MFAYSNNKLQWKSIKNILPKCQKNVWGKRKKKNLTFRYNCH